MDTKPRPDAGFSLLLHDVPFSGGVRLADGVCGYGNHDGSGNVPFLLRHLRPALVLHLLRVD